MKLIRIVLSILMGIVFTLSFGSYIVNSWAKDAVYDQKHWQHTSDIIWQDPIWQERVTDKVHARIIAGNKIERAIIKSLPQKQKPLAPYIANLIEAELEVQLGNVFANSRVEQEWDQASLELHRQVILQLKQDPSFIATNSDLEIDLRPFAAALIEDTKIEKFTDQINKLPASYTTLTPLKSERGRFIVQFAGQMNHYRNVFIWLSIISAVSLLALNRLWVIGIGMVMAGICAELVQNQITDYTTTQLPPTASSRVIQIWWQDVRLALTDYNFVIWGLAMIAIGLIVHLVIRKIKA